ncbi:Aste57867_24464 [Aphanomyces stellatus]|uniref:Aste57867_24464 protein n=1 Tax=Aphanomyces stellatus TaxID=120398 RepID=A0A485LQQ5_9STRA|nr:hypothetical protein As57867_024388 [Aphanomyces stellatus]VFU01103.1 Aste57867_24464 [Aphanomyces stellatus]
MSSSIFQGNKKEMLDAAKEGDLATIKRQFKKDATLVNCQGGGNTPLHRASFWGRLDVVQFLVSKGASIDKINNDGDTPLHSASYKGHLEIARVLVDAGASLILRNPVSFIFDVVFETLDPQDKNTAKDIATTNGHSAFAVYFGETVNELRHSVLSEFTTNKIGQALTSLHRFVPQTGCQNVIDLVHRSVACMCARDKESARNNARACIQLGYTDVCSALVDILVHRGICRMPKYVGRKRNRRKLCKQFGHEAAVKLLLVDMPVKVQNGKLVQCQRHSYSWTTFMDVTVPVDVNVRLICLESILNDPTFNMCTRELLRELVFAKDMHGREVIQITDEATRYPFGLEKHKKFESREEEKRKTTFNLWGKSGSAYLTKDEFLRHCAQQFGKTKVVMKFMKNTDESHRELNNRAHLNAKFVVSFLPSLGGYSMADYPNVVVMPAADRSLDDIYRKRRPSENERRNLLQLVAEALQHLHIKDLVHGDVKKLNVVRVENRLKLIDLDATT